NHVMQSHAMILSAAAGDRVFFETTPAGGGFAGIEYLRTSAFDSLNELRGQRGHTGKVLDKVQRHALGGKNGPRRAGNAHQLLSGFPWLAIRRDMLDFYGLGKFKKSRFRQGESRRHQ